MQVLKKSQTTKTLNDICAKYGLRVTKKGTLDKRPKINKLIIKECEKEFGKDIVVEAMGDKKSLPKNTAP